jgi:hypothetical protein
MSSVNSKKLSQGVSDKIEEVAIKFHSNRPFPFGKIDRPKASEAKLKQPISPAFITNYTS